MNSGEVLIKVEAVRKKFCRSLKKSLWYGAKDMAAELVGGGQNHERLRQGEFWAVDGVSFELRRGECLGLIGRNGAGKTTLLKMLNGLIKPDHGRIEMRGRVGALIALGAGFNPILTGRENIYVNGSILGLSKREIEAKMEQIIEFAGIGEFVDAPVQSYSSGMQVRLGFAVATAIQPDILILDEVLAVGDISFRVQCYNRIRDLLPVTAVILVSHSMWDIAKVCSQIVVMDRGSAAFIGPVREGIAFYNGLNAGKIAGGESLVVDTDANIEAVRVQEVSSESSGNESTVHIALMVTAREGCGAVRFRVVFFDSLDTPVAEWDSADRSLAFQLSGGVNRYELCVGGIRLIAGNYRVAVVVTDMKDQGYHARIDRGVNVTLSPRIVSGIAYRI